MEKCQWLCCMYRIHVQLWLDFRKYVKSLFDTRTKTGFPLFNCHTIVTSPQETPPSVSPPSISDMGGPSWRSLSPLSSVSLIVPGWMLVGRACAAGAKQTSALRMNSALRGRREIAGIAYIPWGPSQAGQGSVSKWNQLVLGFWMMHTLE